MNRKKFISMYTDLIQRAVSLDKKRIRYGISSLEEELEDLDDKDFEEGLRLAVDETEPTIIDEILSNKIAFEKDAYTRQYKTILKRAVLGIQEGLSSRILYYVLSSYANLSSKESRELDYVLMRETREPDITTYDGSRADPDELDL